jgi:hypothetical protein
VSVIVIQFITMDGIVSDPDGSEGTPGGGWAFRHGPETVAGDPARPGGPALSVTAGAGGAASRRRMEDFHDPGT